MKFNLKHFGKAIENYMRKYNTKTDGASSLGELGRGAGKGGGAGGTIREAGGEMGKKAAAKEEEYFHRRQIEQIAVLKKKLMEENSCHKKAIEELKKTIKKNIKTICDIDDYCRR